MSGLTMYAASVPVFDRYLARLSALLGLAEQHAAAQGLAAEALLQARLSPSMFPLAVQVEIAANFSLRACAPLAGLAVPDTTRPPASFEGLQQHIAMARALLAGLTPAQMAGSDTRECSSRAGNGLVRLPGCEFLLQYALPNFFFHLGMAYAILRQSGVAIGKSDFDGFHDYPPAGGLSAPASAPSSP
ncbi:MAG TPA: DUF1993 domain-containing protein [Ideonella sp.]|nr:DUF1993 domain-containing protein [Ideonella sp.]